MAAFEQPAMTNDTAVIATIGILVNGERAACVMPFGNNSETGLTKLNACADLVESIETNCMDNITALMSINAEVTFISCEGMVDGLIPSRSDFPSGTHQGSAEGDSLPPTVAGLIIFYEDPRDVITGHKLRVAKNFIPAMSELQYVGGAVTAEYLTNANTLATQVQQGIGSTADPSANWYRVLAAPKPRTAGQNLKRTVDITVRGYIGTQRRRQLPH